ncbi:oxidoreductase [Fragilaria crotonensis]|nr:oxidoreductase [Fragilaria crotonensis]
MTRPVVAEVVFVLTLLTTLIDAADVINAQIGISPQSLVGGPSNAQNQNALLSVTANVAPLDPVLGSIAGNVTLDTDNDDVGDAVLADILVLLQNDIGSVLATTITDSLGNYVFHNLPPGQYLVNQTNVESGLLDVKDRDGGNPNIIAVGLGSGENSTGNDFVDEPCRQIIVDVEEDTDNDGNGDKPIPLVKVELRAPISDTTDVILLNFRTDNSGKIDFQCVPPGKYKLVQFNNRGYLDVGKPDGGNPNVVNVDVTKGNSLGNRFVDRLPPTRAPVPPPPTRAPVTRPPTRAPVIRGNQTPVPLPTVSPTVQPVLNQTVTPTAPLDALQTNVPTQAPTLLPTNDPTLVRPLSQPPRPLYRRPTTRHLIRLHFQPLHQLYRRPTILPSPDFFSNSLTNSSTNQPSHVS